MAVEYFGHCDSSGNPTARDGGASGGYNTDLWAYTIDTLTCPGSGSMTIRQMSVYANDAGTPGTNARLGIYTTGGSLVVDLGTTGTIGSSEAWYSVGNGTTDNLGTLTGGANYRLMVFINGVSGSYPRILYTNGSTGDGSLNTGTDYSSGLPSSLPGVYGYPNKWILRVGVESGGGSSPSAYYAYAQQ